MTRAKMMEARELYHSFISRFAVMALQQKHICTYFCRSLGYDIRRIDRPWGLPDQVCSRWAMFCGPTHNCRFHPRSKHGQSYLCNLQQPTILYLSLPWPVQNSICYQFKWQVVLLVNKSMENKQTWTRPSSCYWVYLNMSQWGNWAGSELVLTSKHRLRTMT